MDDTIIMKLDAIEISDKKPVRSCGTHAIKAMEQKLRKFFDEADGHGSLIHKPPPTMMTPQYFKVTNTVSYYPIRRMDWIAFVNSSNYKKKILKTFVLPKVPRPNFSIPARSESEKKK